MNVKTVTTIMIAIMAIGLTGLATATTVTYTGDGSYDATFSGVGDGTLNIYTSTTYGFDAMEAEWDNTKISGTQSMDTSDWSFWVLSGGNTEINRDITVGDPTNIYSLGNSVIDSSGTILTYTEDNGGHEITTGATYRDDVAYDSHVTLSQNIDVKDGFLFDGVRGDVLISGHAYGDDTLVEGYVSVNTGDVYATALMSVTEGELTYMDVDYVSTRDIARMGKPTTQFWFRVIPSVDGIDAAAVGEGLFRATVGFDEHDFDTTAILDGSVTNYASIGYNEGVTLVDPFDGDYTVAGYVYAVDI